MKVIYFAEESWEEAYVQEKLPDTEFASVEGSLDAHPEARDESAEVLSIFINSHIGPKELDRFPSLKLIATRSTGFDHIDLAECKKRGVAVASVPTYGMNTVAEFAFALLLALVRHVREAASRCEEGSFEQKHLTGLDLQGKTMGIIGSGRIGAHAIGIAKGFGMEVVAYDVFENKELAAKLGFTYAALDELLSRSDFISIHAPYTKETHHLLNSENLPKMKRGAYLINTARGAIVESAALLRAFEDGSLAGAGLDVLEAEGDMDDPTNAALIAKHNVLVTPHIGFDTTEAIKRILDTTAENISSFASGTPKNLVS